MAELHLIATATFGLEAVVKRELEALGYAAAIRQNGRVHFTGDERALVRANLHLRTADRVLLCIGEFEARDFGALFDVTGSLPWEQWIGPQSAFPVSGRSVDSQLSSVPACQRAVKKAIVERLLTAHRASTLPEDGPKYQVEVALLKDQVTLTLDTSGAGLHKRGYRPQVGIAPLRETLAAALVMLSFWKPGRPLIDPFCGTGTICIEAALLGRNIPPGLQRSFASEDWPQIPAELWQEARDAARAAIAPPLEERILGFDVDERSLRLARENARRAGVENDIHFQRADFLNLQSSRDFGCLIANPPYGQRLGAEDDLDALYRAIPDVLRRLPTWSHYLLTAYPDFEKLIGQPAARRRKLYNGRIECTYYQFHGPHPQDDKREAAPAFGGLPAKTERQAEDFRNRLLKNARHLRKLPARGITCYRLYDRDVPDVPLIIDRYEDHLHLGEYDRPNEHTAAQHADWLDYLAQVAAEVLELPAENVFAKFRRKQRGLSQHEKVGEERHELIVGEQGLRFIVNLSDYVDTGLFLDHRQTRAMVRQRAAGQRVLNLFCYTGAFTVYAAAGGAASTLSVDLSHNYLDWAKRNLELNGLADPARHRFLRADVLPFLRTCRERFDLIVADPPTFSNSKSTESDWEVLRDHVELLTLLLGVLAPGGMIFFSTNFRRFKLNQAALPPCRVREISKQTVPADYRNQRIHRCWVLEAGAAEE